MKENLEMERIKEEKVVVKTRERLASIMMIVVKLFLINVRA